jgi:hypothetical protein
VRRARIAFLLLLGSCGSDSRCLVASCGLNAPCPSGFTCVPAPEEGVCPTLCARVPDAGVGPLDAGP